ncbi:peptidylprolyl isomerase [soil metagenome]
MAKSDRPTATPKPGAGATGKQEPEAKPSLKQKVSSVFASKPSGPPEKKRRVSRKERDDRRTRFLYISLTVLGVLAITLLSASALDEYFLKPRKVLATVEGDDITRRDYWKYQSHSLLNQAIEYQQFAQFFEGQQQQQYIALSQQAMAQLDTVWGSTSVDETTLSRMIDDKVIVQSIGSLGLSIESGEVDEYVDEQFADPAAPISSPTPTQTFIPERAEWATQTAEAQVVPASPEAGGGSPIPVEDASPVPVASPVTGSPAASGSPDSSGSPVVAASPVASATSTVGPEDARATSQANQENYSDDFLADSHMSMGDYKRLVAEPSLARDKVNAHFAAELGQSAEQVHARHILIGTQELAAQIYDQLQTNPELFPDFAQESSIDDGTAVNGGDLGWFPRGIMVVQFEDVAFGLSPGDIAEPFQTEFGWHIIQVLDRDSDRALTDTQITQSSQAMVDRWLQAQRQTLEISADIEPTPTPSLAQFVPPADAPDPPAPTPEGSPVPLPQASPRSSPVAMPEASPDPSPTPSG